MGSFLWGQDTSSVTDETQLKIIDTDSTSQTDEQEDIALDNDMITASDYIRMIFVLALVIGLIYIIYYFMKKFSGRVSYNSELIKAISTKTIGNNKHLQVIQVGNSILLIGVTDNSISLIKEIEDQETKDQFKLEASRIDSKNVSFQTLINNILTKKGEESSPESSAKTSAEFIKLQRDRLKRLGDDEGIDNEQN
ncbi:flagellar biosynthetic protein FliO [Spirochaeta cellobiosiphila]|uniref:flagellar biosynthetic protein FliO n=1 Tax=Spirochaeta cellobiosiphila TaxID=504483 RepID=UPI001B7FE2E1|nr:flagellar biosynthetic protein FliO [Spirochaeta cellobiosiphila]